MAINFTVHKSGLKEGEDWSVPYFCALHVVAGGREFVSRQAIAQFSEDSITFPTIGEWTNKTYAHPQGSTVAIDTEEEDGFVHINLEHVSAIWIETRGHADLT